MKFNRVINLEKLLSRKSAFLFGARWTGKTFAIKQQLDSSWHKINLLQSKYRLPLSENPSQLEDMIRSSKKSKIVIDEIQKLPSLLDEVHHLIEKEDYLFLLTGSSARKLRKDGANLLAGRAQRLFLYPLTYYEISSQNYEFELDKFLKFGSLPQVYLSKDQQQELYDYVDTYLTEEIQAEAIIRNISGFSRFLKYAALNNGEVLNFTKMGNDAQVSPSTIRDFFQVLEDTLIGYQLPPWKSPKRKAIQTSKFYFFDIGVANTLAQIKMIDEHSNIYGTCFEHFIINEVRAYLSYTNKREPLSFWRTRDKHEVDLIIGEQIAIEIKSTKKINENHKKGLKLITEETNFNQLFLVSRDPVSMIDNYKIHSIHWRDFLKKLWGNEICVRDT